MNRVSRFLRRLLNEHLEVRSMPIPKTAMVTMCFYDDGSAIIDARMGYVLTTKQNEALGRFVADQMDMTMEMVLDKFEETRRRMDKVVEFPTRVPTIHEVN